MMKRYSSLCAIALAGCLLLTGCSRDPNQRKQEYLESGNRYFENKQFPEAVIEYRNAIQIDIEMPEVGIVDIGLKIYLLIGI